MMMETHRNRLEGVSIGPLHVSLQGSFHNRTLCIDKKEWHFILFIPLDCCLLEDAVRPEVLNLQVKGGWFA
jgi:hypothetical protein